ncbi:aspartyl protease family protein [Chitinophaga vietnamensis]|uniref:aspartyl protease family protein n=1 Tax=Chitinophaga vietnamensis TaxID=2593957 RepID=UPI001177E492|nr:aspartyl protease family protein [Chitinophaga vietnamensis]
MWRFLWLVWVISCAASIPVFAQRKKEAAEPDNKKPVAVIPFRIIDRHVVIPAVLSGSKDTLHFIFDTGAEVTVLDARVATRLRLNGSKEAFMSGVNNGMIKVPVTSINAMYLNEIRLPYVNAYIENLENISPVTPMDGVIGVALLKAYIVKIDYRQQQLVCYHKGRTPIGNTGRLVHFQLNYTTPVIDAVVQLPDGRTIPGHYHLTSGGDYGILFNWPFVDKNKLNTLLPTANTDRVQDMAKVLYYINSSIPQLELAGHNIKQVPVSYSKDVDDVGAFTEIAGAIGYEVWKQFTLTINYDKKELYIE